MIPVQSYAPHEAKAAAIVQQLAAHRTATGETVDTGAEQRRAS